MISLLEAVAVLCVLVASVGAVGGQQVVGGGGEADRALLPILARLTRPHEASATLPVPLRSEPTEAIREQWIAEGGDGTNLAFLAHLARLTWPHELVPWLLETARCETGGTFDLYAYSSAGPYHGAMQVWSAHFAPDEDMNDPLTNLRVAYHVYQRQGVIAWPVCGVMVRHLLQ